MHTIEVKGLSLIVRKKNILSEINMTCEKGKVYGLIGRNGSGKTMLMKCICGFVKPTQGCVVVNGKMIGRDLDFPESIGILIENPGFIPYYSGFRNLKILAAFQGKIGTKEICECMKRVGLQAVAKKHVGKYSLGMRQRLGLAQAIMENPSIYVLDEPMNGLDNNGMKIIRELLMEEKQKGKTILMASHSAEDINYLCDSVFTIDDGKIVNQRE